MKRIEEQVIVITGGSSGIGRLTAIEAARRGARVVIAARGEEALRAAEAEVRAAGGEVLAVRTDVADHAQVAELGRRAIERFGRIDTWVNDAGVSVYGALAEVTPAEFQRVIDVNLMGAVHGSMVALAHLQRNDEGGAIVNVASGLGERAVPLQSAYCASKFGVVGFSEALRTELIHDRAPIQVAIIKPSAIDTPIFDHARTKMGVRAKAVNPVYDPSLVASAILHAASHRVRDLSVGGAAAGLKALEAISPALADWSLAIVGEVDQRTDDPKGPTEANNLFEGIRGPGAIHGRGGGTKISPYTWLAIHPVARRAALGAAALAGAVLAIRRRG